MLKSLLQIAINGPSVSQAKDVVEQAVGLWLQEKQRRNLPQITAIPCLLYFKIRPCPDDLWGATGEHSGTASFADLH